MSRYRMTMAEALRKVYEDGHEDVSSSKRMCQTIIEDATQIRTKLDSMSAEDKLDTWWTNKLAKSADNLNSARDYIMNPIEEELQERTYDPIQFGPDKVAKAMAIATKSSGNYSGAVKDIEKIARNLSKVSTIARELKKQNEEVELDEGRMKTIYTMQQQGKSAAEIAKYMKLPVKTIKDILGESNLRYSVKFSYSKGGKIANAFYQSKDEAEKFVKSVIAKGGKAIMTTEEDELEESLIEFTSSQIKDLQKSYGDLKGKTISPEKATALSKHLDRIDLMSLRQLLKAKIPFVSTLARNKIYKKTGKFEDIREQDDQATALAAKDKEIENLKSQLALQKQKIENEKNKAVKPTPNPETGEVPLTIGLANKLIKDKEAKEKAAEADRKEKKSADMKDRILKLKDKIKEDFLNESDASDKAKSMGLDYMKFGRYGKDGKVTHKSIGGNLTAVDKDENPIDEPKTSKDKTKSDPKVSAEPQKSKPQVDSFEAKKDLEKVVTDGAIEVEADDKGTMSMTKEYDPSQDYEAENDVKEIKKYLMSKGVDEKDIYVEVDGDEDEEYLQINVEVRPKTTKEAFTVQITKKDGGKLVHGKYKTKADADKFVKWYKTGDMKDTKSIEVIQEADLTKPQIKKVHKMADELPKKDFKDRYGKEKGDAVRYATATNIVKKKLGIESAFNPKVHNTKLGVTTKDLDRAFKQLSQRAQTHVNDLLRTGMGTRDAIKKAKEKFNEGDMKNEKMRLRVEAIAGLKKKAEKSGMPYSILKKVYDRGMAAWKGGHRPGASQHQWAFARVNSFVTKSSGTWGGADKDLAKQVRGSK